MRSTQPAEAMTLSELTTLLTPFHGCGTVTSCGGARISERVGVARVNKAVLTTRSETTRTLRPSSHYRFGEGVGSERTHPRI